MTAPYLGHLVRLAVPMQGHADAQASASGTLTDGSGIIIWPNLVVKLSQTPLLLNEQKTGVGVFDAVLSGGGTIVDEVIGEHQENRYLVVRVDAINYNNEGFTITRGQIDVLVDWNGRHRASPNFSDLSVRTNRNEQYKITPFAEVGSPRVTFNIFNTFPNQFHQIGGEYYIDVIESFTSPDDPSFIPTESNESVIIDSFTVNHVSGASNIYHAQSLNKIGVNWFMTYFP